MRTRADHLNWAKQRALKYVELGDLPNALASMMSDLEKHPETRMNPMLPMLGTQEIQHGPEAMRKWINIAPDSSALIAAYSCSKSKNPLSITSLLSFTQANPAPSLLDLKHSS